MNNTDQVAIVGLLTTEVSHIFRLVNFSILSALVALLGIISNIINMIVFYKQGLTTTINISFFALAISDLLCLITLEWYDICLNPYMETDAIPFIPQEFQYLTGGWLHVCFGRITSWITVYVTAERCLSVALPLKVKQIVSLRKTTVCMWAIFIINIMMLLPEYCIAYIDWKFVPERNKTFLGLVYRSFKDKGYGLVYTLTSISGMMSFVAVIILTIFLTIKLAQKSTWLQKTSVQNSQFEARSIRDKKTIKMVMMITMILIVCYTPGTITSLVTVFVSDFILVGRYKNTFFVCWSFSFLAGSINSSVNILLYFTMSTKYRETFKQIFATCTNSMGN